MIGRFSLFAFILGVPIIGFLVASGIQGHMNSELRDAVRAQFPDADPAQISTMTIEALQDEDTPELKEVYRTYSILGAMKTGAIVVGAIGLLLLLAIKIGGTAAANDRNLLLSLFRPGIYITAFALMGLMLAYAALAIGTIYYGESVIAGRIHVSIILAIGLGAIVGVATMTRSTLTMVQKARALVLGRAVPRETAPELWGRVEKIADGLGALKPEHIVVGLDPNFFVTEADVVCLDGTISGRTMYCSLPLSRIMTAGEFSAVIGHELGHFKGQDTKFSEGFYPIYRGTITSLSSLREASGGWRAIAMLPALAILTYFLECFSTAEARIGRERELIADKEGASVTDAATIASALVKVHAFAGLYGGVQNAAAEVLKDGKMLVNVSEAFAKAVADVAKAEALDGIADRQLRHPTDSHPPLGVRLESLGITIEQVSGAALAVSPSEPAIVMVPNHEEKEKDVSNAFQALLARQLGIAPGAQLQAG